MVGAPGADAGESTSSRPNMQVVVDSASLSMKSNPQESPSTKMVGCPTPSHRALTWRPSPTSTVASNVTVTGRGDTAVPGAVSDGRGSCGPGVPVAWPPLPDDGKSGVGDTDP